MVACCMKKLTGLLLSWMFSVYGVEIPLEEGLSVSDLTNGVQLWLKEHATQDKNIAFRVVAKHPLKEVPLILPLDCASDEIEDQLPCFIEYCQKSIQNEKESKIAVVAVGDFDKNGLKEFLTEAFAVFSQPHINSVRMISVNPSQESDMVYVSLCYPTTFEQLRTDQDLKKLWVLCLLQSIAEEKFRKKLTSIDGQWIQPAQVKYMLPYTHTIARGKQPLHGEPDSMLTAFLTVIQEFKGSGFTEQDLSEAKAKLQKNLLGFYQQNPTNGTLADYFAAHFSLGAGRPSYPIFMAMSLRAIAEVEKKDLAEALGYYFNDSPRLVDMKVPVSAPVTEESIQKKLDHYKTDNLVLNLNGNPEEANLGEGQLPYSQIPISAAEAQIIYEIIDALGNTGYYDLYKKQDDLKKLGQKVQHVHPLRFLGTVFTNPHLKKSMIEVRDGIFNFKWNGFMHGEKEVPGFVHKCERESSRNNIMPYVVGFSQAVKAHPDQVRMFIEKREWEKLVKFLIMLEN